MTYCAVLGSSHLAQATAVQWLRWGADVTHHVLDDRCQVRGRLHAADEPDLDAALAAALEEGRYAVSWPLIRPIAAAVRYEVIHVAEDFVAGGGRSVDVVLDVVIEVVASAHQEAVVVVSSQVPVGTARALQRRIEASGSAAVVVSSPENYQVGGAFRAIEESAPLPVGADCAAHVAQLESLLPEGVRVDHLGDTVAIELAKHVRNALLATLMSFGNELGALCRDLGADVSDVLSAVLADRRLNAGLPIRPGRPVDAPTIMRDLRRLTSNPTEVPLLRSVTDINDCAIAAAVAAVVDEVTAGGASAVLLLGVGYKAEAWFPHRSFGTDLLEACLASGLVVGAYHPGFDVVAGRAWPEVVWVTNPSQIPPDIGVIIDVLPELASFMEASALVLRIDPFLAGQAAP